MEAKAYNKQCLVCKASFDKPRKYSHEQFASTTCCSLKCRNTLSKGRHLSPATQFRIGHVGYKSMLGKTLSKEHLAKIKANRTPPTYRLGKRFTVAHRNKLSAAKVGKRPWNWRGLTVRISTQIRTSVFYNKWRRSIFERDRFTCTLCHTKSGILNVDHFPKTFSFLLLENNITTLQAALHCEALWNANNARTLCFSCHKKTDSYGSRAIVYNRTFTYA
jgi:5-methylcytosine-specific restriction endonuclease McrA